MKNLMAVVLVLILSGCVAPEPIPSAAMMPNEAVYDQIPKSPYLKNKIIVGEFGVAGVSKESSAAIQLSNYSVALENALKRAGLVAPSGAVNAYNLTGNIKEINAIHCYFGTCNGGSAVDYALTYKGKVVWQQTVVVPYTMGFTFGQNGEMILHKFRVETIGANIAQVVQIISRKTKSDLE